LAWGGRELFKRLNNRECFFKGLFSPYGACAVFALIKKEGLITPLDLSYLNSCKTRHFFTTFPTSNPTFFNTTKTTISLRQLKQ